MKQSDCLLCSDRIEEPRLASSCVRQVIDQDKPHDLSLVNSLANELEEGGVGDDQVVQGHLDRVNEPLSQEYDLPSQLVIAGKWKKYSLRISTEFYFEKVKTNYTQSLTFFEKV